jgi:hypothetical protein
MMPNVTVQATTGYESGNSSQFIFNNLGSSGELAIAMFTHRATETFTSVPTGWTSLDPPTIDGGGASDPFLRTYYKELGTGESATFTFEKSDNVGGAHCAAFFLSDYKTSNISTGEAEADTGTSTAHNFPNSTVPTGSAGGCAVGIVGAMQASSTNVWTTTSAGWTKSYGDQFAAGTLRSSIGAFYSTNVSTGTLTGIKCNGANSASGVTGVLIVNPDASSNPPSRFQYHRGMIQR